MVDGTNGLWKTHASPVRSSGLRLLSDAGFTMRITEDHASASSADRAARAFEFVKHSEANDIGLTVSVASGGVVERLLTIAGVRDTFTYR